MRPSVLMSVVFACALSATGALFAGNEEWTSFGPQGERVKFLVVDPQKPGGIYAVSLTGRPFKSMDSGTSWKALPSPIQGSGINVLAINPQLSSTLYAGTQIGGVYRSTDAGASWEAANSGLPNGGRGGNVSSLVIDPESPSTLYATIYWHPFWLLVKSTDGGGSWSAAAPFRSVPVWRSYRAWLTADLHNPGTLYLGTGDHDDDYGPGAGLYKTTDGGMNWARASVPDGHWSPLVFDPKNPGTVYADVCDFSEDFCTTFKSTDGGANWKEFTIGLFAGYYSTRITFDPENTSILYAVIYDYGSQRIHGLYKTIDGGASWSMLDSGLATTYSLVPDPHATGTLYVATDDGVIRSRDGGTSWTLVNSGLVGTSISVSALAIDPQFPNTLYAVTSLNAGSSLAKSEDGGESWIRGGRGLPDLVNSLAIDPRNPGTLYAASQGGEVFKTTDGAMNWSNQSPPGVHSRPLALDPQNPNTIYVAVLSGSGALYKSTDGASSWTQVNTGAGNVDLRSISGISIDPRDPANIYLLALYVPVLKSKDGGKSFSPAISGLPRSGYFYGGRLAIDPQSTSTLYVWGRYIDIDGQFVPGSNVLSRSTDGAASWSPLKPGLPEDVIVTHLLIDPQQPSTLYAASTSGVWKSTDSGRNWRGINAGLTTLSVSQLAFDPQNSRRVFAGTLGGGVFTITFDASTGTSTSPATPGLN